MSNKKVLIIENALDILKTGGDNALTMRQVATKSGISLSNVQYYYKTKNELLKAMVDNYFSECSLFFAKHVSNDNQTSKQKIEQLIRFGLDEEENLIEMCHMFREFWAISSRNKEIKDYVNSYYKDYSKNLSSYFDNMESTPENIEKVVSFLMPYFEGYNITKNAIPLSHETLVKTLVETVEFLLFNKN